MSAKSEAERLKKRVAHIQAIVASLPDRDSRTDDEIIGYDELGLPTDAGPDRRERRGVSNR